MTVHTFTSLHDIPESLQAFLFAKTDTGIRTGAAGAQPLYASYPKGSDEYNYDVVSLLEIATEVGKLAHVRVLLESQKTEYGRIVCSFYRALEQQQKSIALLLLDHLNVSDLAKLILKTSDPLSLFDEYQGNYLKKISKTKHYVFGFNNKAVTGNIALIMAAALPDASLFNLLLTYESLKRQLDDSGIAAFLVATLDDNGDVKAKINEDIAFQLLSLPHVLSYAASRPFDFEALLNEFRESVENDCALSASSVTTLENYSRSTSRMSEASPVNLSAPPPSTTYHFRALNMNRTISLSPGGVRVNRHTPSLFSPDTPRPSGSDTSLSALTQVESMSSFRTLSSMSNNSNRVASTAEFEKDDSEENHAVGLPIG